MERNFIVCDCGEHAVSVDLYDDGETYLVFMSFWSAGHHGGACRCWKCRLRHIWHIIRHGTPYTDMIIFDKYSILRVLNALDFAKCKAWGVDWGEEDKDNDLEDEDEE